MTFIWNTTRCHNLINKYYRNQSVSDYLQPTITSFEAIAMILCFGLFAAGTAYAFTIIRKKVYCDKDNLDTAFDAGGNVNVGLTATTVVSQWTWSSAILNSSSICIKYGVAGPLWYGAGATIQLCIFAMVSIQLRLKAPGAKTFLQVIKARFGRRTHIVYCGFAIVANVVTTSITMLGGATALTILVQDLDVQYGSVLVTVVIGIYTAIGGLGATFYVSYFTSAAMYIGVIVFVMRVYTSPQNHSPIGSAEAIYEAVSCLEGPGGNHDNSYFTILSAPALMFGIINIVGNFGAAFMDQSYWQSSVAAKPRAGVWGFLLSGMVFFTIPFCMSMSIGYSYLAYSAQQRSPLLNDDQLESGLAAPVVARMLLGGVGERIMTFMVLMAMTSTGSAEVIAVTSLLIYDVYQTHLKPYRRANDTNSCILCGKQRGRKANPRDKCVCVSMRPCVKCREDDEVQLANTRVLKPPYTCVTHGNYRAYLDYLTVLKNWCLVWTTISIFPLCMILDLLHISLGWLYMLMGILTSSCVFPVTLGLVWPRTTGFGMMLGAAGGSAVAIIVWLSVASTYEGGLANFFANTGKELPMLIGNVVSIIGGLVLCVAGSYVSNRNYDAAHDNEIWENTRDIDNPLTPWTELFAQELNLTKAHELFSRPSLADMTRRFRTSTLTAYTGAPVLVALFIIVWPASLIPLGVMTSMNFQGWVYFVLVVGVICTLFIIIVPLVYEIMDIRRALTRLHSGSTRIYPTTSNLTSVNITNSRSANQKRMGRP